MCRFACDGLRSHESDDHEDYATFFSFRPVDGANIHEQKKTTHFGYLKLSETFSAENTQTNPFVTLGSFHTVTKLRCRLRSPVY